MIKLNNGALIGCDHIGGTPEDPERCKAQAHCDLLLTAAGTWTARFPDDWQAGRNGDPSAGPLSPVVARCPAHRLERKLVQPAPAGLVVAPH